MIAILQQQKIDAECTFEHHSKRASETQLLYKKIFF